MGILVEPSVLGDTRIEWDVEEEASVDVARNAFYRLKGEGYNAFQMDNGKKGEVVEDFDPAAEKIIMALPMAGG
jgi:hypothetical protein